MIREREIARYVLISVLLLGVSGGATYWAYPLVVSGAPHKWVAALYAMSAAALVGGLVCDRWRMVAVVARFIGGSIADLIGGLGAAGPGAGGIGGAQAIADFQRQLEEVKQQLAGVKAELEIERQGRVQDTHRIALLESRLHAAETLSVRVVTGAVLELLGILLGLVASLLWVANIA